MKPSGTKKKTRTTTSLTRINEEDVNNHALDSDSNGSIEEERKHKTSKTPSKIPRGMKNGVRRDPKVEALSMAQRAEKYYELHDENEKLKKHQTELDEDIKRMAARLKRIKSLISKERKLAGGVLGNEFDRELDVIIDENFDVKNENRKLKTTIKNLKAELKNKGPYRPRTKGTSPTKKVEDDSPQLELINKLRERLKENIKVIESYKEENLLLRKGKPDMEASRDIIKKIETNDNEIIRMKCSLQEVTANYEGLNKVFENCKKKNAEFLDEIREKKNQIINLTAQLTALERTQGAVDDLREQLKEAEKEKYDMESRLKDLLTEPFLKRETGTSSNNRIAKLEMERDEKEKIIRNFKEKLLKQEEKMGEMEAEVDRITRDAKESKEMYEELKIRYEGNGEMTIETVTKQLQRIDPSAFRKTMDDLNYQGIDAAWDRTGGDESSEEIDINDPKSLHREIERLRHSKRDIAAELEK